jgi:hypothetical protein
VTDAAPARAVATAIARAAPPAPKQHDRFPGRVGHTQQGDDALSVGVLADQLAVAGDGDAVDGTDLSLPRRTSR